MSARIRTGVVKTIINRGPTRHWGFITPDGGGKDVFFHVMDGRVFEPSGAGPQPTRMPLVRVPGTGDRVAYLADDSSERGPKAKPWGFADGSGGY